MLSWLRRREHSRQRRHAVCSDSGANARLDERGGGGLVTARQLDFNRVAANPATHRKSPRDELLLSGPRQ